MKRYLLYAFIWITFASYGQLSFGVKGGGNFGTVVFNTREFAVVSEQYRLDVVFRGYAGLYSELPITENLFVRAEASYLLTGGKQSSPGRRPSTYNFGYLFAPLSIGYKLNSIVTLFTGFHSSILISENNYDNGLPKEYMNKIDFGLQLGIESMIKDNFGIGIQYSHGLRDMQRTTEPFVFDFQLHNRGVQLYLKFGINLKKK